MDRRRVKREMRVMVVILRLMALKRVVSWDFFHSGCPIMVESSSLLDRLETGSGFELRKDTDSISSA